MTLNDMGPVMDILTTAFPTFYNRQTDAERKAAMRLWACMFADKPAEVVMLALKALIATKTDSFPPTIGAINAQIAELQSTQDMDEMDAWNLVKEAVRNTDRFAPGRQYKKLPESVQRAIGSPQTLVDWGNTGEEEFNTVIMSHFIRVFRARRESAKKYTALPPDVKKFIGTVSEHLRLGEPGGPNEE